MAQSEVVHGLKRNGCRFMERMERIFEKYSQPFEEDLVINLEDMTVDTPSGPIIWCPTDSQLCLPRKQARNNFHKKYEKLYEPDVSQEQDKKLCAPDESQEKLMSTKLSSQTYQASDTEVLKDGPCIQSTSKLQTSLSMGNMNVGDKYKIDVDILATGNDDLGKQVLVECVGRAKNKPVIMFTPTSKVKVGLSHAYHDCSDDFQTTISGDLNHSSRSDHDDKDDSNLASSMSYDQLLAKPLCGLGSKKLSYPLRFEKSRSNVLDLSETVSTCIDQCSVESHDDTSSGLSDTTLIDIYPNMLASMSNLLDRSYKMQVASRLIKHYRRLQLNAWKSKLNTTRDGIRMKVKMDTHALKNVEDYPILELKASAGATLMNGKVCSLKRYETTECNLDTILSTAAAEGSMSAQQTNSKSSEVETSKFRNSFDDASYSRPLLLSPLNPKSPVPVTNCCNMRKTSPCIVTSLNGPSLPQLDIMTNSSFKCLSTKPNMAKAHSPCSSFILNHPPKAKLSPLNNSTVTKQDSVVANFSRSPFRMLLCSSNISCTGQSSKRRHSFSSGSSVPTMFRSIRSPFKTQVKEMDAFESVYRNLVCTVTSVRNTPSQLSRKRAACIDQSRETSRLPLKRFRSFPEPSNSRQSRQEMLLLNTVLQGQNYHSKQMSGFYSPRSWHPRENITLGPFIKWKDNASMYSSCGTALPVINSSGNTVSLCLSPRLQSRVSRKLDYSKLNTPV
ncbi:uncharacterized protein LOC121290318 isoform X1 [Carcharodon carcharias]|uniref:uncharacterized protein LOC121290318 isoform X1 n=1 Tax=Carcharodon carcharias TaxID=13397 RepID=UPI001B7DC52F|nr:uncharacterized protein LOC121290318 isoform X1 [Carcharodon carcharias]